MIWRDTRCAWQVWGDSGRGSSTASRLDSQVSPNRLLDLDMSFERKDYFDSETQPTLLTFWRAKKLSL